MNKDTFLSGKYEIHLDTIFATEVHETGNPEKPYWTEQLRDRMCYRVCITNKTNNTMIAIQSRDFGDNPEQQFAAYECLNYLISDAITRNVIPKDQCPQYHLDENGSLTPSRLPP